MKNDGLQHTKRFVSLFPQANCKQLLINIWHDVKKEIFSIIIEYFFVTSLRFCYRIPVCCNTMKIGRIMEYKFYCAIG